MSYILEALKKSEQERNPDKVPDLSTHHQAVSSETKSKFPWIWLVATLVIINFAAIYWFVIKDSGSENNAIIESKIQTPVVETSSTDIRPIPETESVTQNNSTDPVSQGNVVTESQEKVVTPTPRERSVLQQTPQSPTPEPEEVIVVQPVKPIVIGPPKFEQLPHITELSQGIQNQLPAISFSTHIYVKEGGSFVIINDRNLSQGMSISNGIVLEKIVREGVILSFRERYFTLNSMESWQK